MERRSLEQKIAERELELTPIYQQVKSRILSVGCFFLPVFKESVSSSMLSMRLLLVGLCLSPFSWAMKNGDNKGKLRDDTCTACWMKLLLLLCSIHFEWVR